MGTTLRAFFLCLVWAGILTMQLNFDADSTATRRLKDALELATHDAALYLKTDELANGRIVFDQTLATQTLKKSLEMNLSLDTSLTPLSTSFFKDEGQIKLLLVEFVDDSNTLAYPTNYFNSTYEIIDTIEGPAIVAVLETTGPRWFGGTKKTIRQAVVYEYKHY
ncbi:peptidase M23 [Cytobacillus sp. FJAT-54145]|uniref:Peptidase M23 n=1 Tax=Cytobacillus spartinae TaxID=3299023 RepID=A0ABW6KI54_9BACI